ncbi:MAG: S41 family peptidase [Desulforhopalus sp.]|nr:S41 family peptidase [Desulforhopalus sp.]
MLRLPILPMFRLTPCRIIVSIILSALFFTGPAMAATDAQNQEKKRQEELTRTYKQLEVFSNVLSMLQENYVEEVDTADVLNGAIKGLLLNLDPHSSYLTPEEFKDLQEETSGQFTGIGIEVTVQNNELTVVSPIHGTPAESAGLKAGDLIVSINDENTANIGAYKAIEKLRGPEGSKVNLAVIRKGWASPRNFKITRANIPLLSVEGESLSPGLGYARITNFQSNTGADLRHLLGTLSQKAPIQGLILDLRNNPGGLLDQAVEVVDTFLNQGCIVYTRGRRADQNTIYNAHNNSPHANYPLVVLINEGSASASEIVAGAIQAHKRGILVGKKSFGKGSVQMVIPLPDGAGLRLTTARYYTPDNRSIQAVGIIPDVEVAEQNNEEEGSMISEAPKEIDLANHLPGEAEKENLREQEQNTGEVEALQKRLAADNQLHAAYNILKSLNLYTKQKTKKEKL